MPLLDMLAVRHPVGLLHAGSGARAPPDPPTDVYVWGERSLAFHRCRECGCVSHWAAVDQEGDRMGVNARLMDPGVLATARVRHSDGPPGARGTERPRSTRST